MLNSTNNFRKLCLSCCFLVGITSLTRSANAQFIGINADYAIDYSAAPGKVSGYSIGIAHPAPFIPNIGYSSVSFEDKETITDSSNKVSLATTTTIKTINFFYNVPFPVVTITLGIGHGADNLNTLTVFIKCRSPYTVKLATSERGLQHVTCIHSTFCLSCANHGVHLIDEKNDLSLLAS